MLDGLKALRLQRGLSQRDLAQQLGMLHQTYSNYETGRREADYETLGKLSEFFSVPIDFLLSRSPFDCFELVEQNRAAFFDKVAEDPDFLMEHFNIDRFNPDAAALSDVVNYIGTTYKYIELEPDGNWHLARKIPYAGKWYFDGEDEGIRVALFGGDGEVSDKAWDEVKSFVEFVKQREKEKYGKP